MPKKYRKVNKHKSNYSDFEYKSHSFGWTDILVYGQTIIREKPDESNAPKRRIFLMTVLIFISMSLLFAKLFTMQVISADEYIAQANGNRVRLIVDYAPRGKILDKNGKVLADNSLVFQLSATPYLLEEDDAEAEKDIRLVANTLKMNPKQVREKVFEKGEEFVQPLVVADVLDHNQALKLESVMPKLKGFSLDQIPVREYDSSFGLAHIVGYTGRVSDDDLENSQVENLLPTDFIGKAGVEESFDSVLRGQNGWQRIEVDALGRPVRVLDKQAPVAGKDLTLSIDYDVQKAMYQAVSEQMKKAKVERASSVAVNPSTGAMIALVSIPSYDNNLFSGGISQKDFSKLVNDPKQPLYNKAIAGGYTSGSVIKPMVASAALQENVVTPDTVVNDVNAISPPGSNISFRSWRPGGLGPMNVRSAIAWSSNIYFYTVGGGHGSIEGLGGERLQKYYRHFGLGELSGIPLPGEFPGRVPDEKWKLENKGEYWYQGDSYNISIGQGDLLITPLQIAMAHSSIANNGYLLQPQLEDGVSRVVRREIDVSKENLQIVREGMRQVLTGGTTCECTFKDVPVQVAGKSGTAETNTPGGRRPHAWYSAYAPYDGTPEILVTVMLEEGVGGSQFAAPAINKTMAEYYR